MENKTWGTAPLQEGRSTAHRVWAEDFGPNYGLLYTTIAVEPDALQTEIEAVANNIDSIAPDVHATIGLKNESRSDAEIVTMTLGFAFASQARADEVQALVFGGEA